MPLEQHYFTIFVVSRDTYAGKQPLKYVLSHSFGLGSSQKIRGIFIFPGVMSLTAVPLRFIQHSCAAMIMWMAYRSEVSIPILQPEAMQNKHKAEERHP